VSPSPVACRPLARTIEVRDGETLLEAALREHVPLASSCGGKAVCGDCIVRIHAGEAAVAAPDGDELAWRARRGVTDKVRLACCLRPGAPMEVSTTYW